MNNNKHFLRASLLALALLSTLNLMSCDTSVTPGMTETLEISGTWLMDGGSTWAFTETTFTVTNDPSWTWDYSGDVVAYSNDSFNTVSENPAIGDYGFALLKITAHTGDPDQVGNYTILRWQTLATASAITTMQYSEGYKAGATPFTDEVSAKAGMTTADGYFSFFSAATKQ